VIANQSPTRAAVVWYSQTGHTARIGRVVQRSLEAAGLVVDARDYREFEVSKLGDYDLVVVGTPVFYFNVPSNFEAWLKSAPPLQGKAAAAFVTFGGHGDGQRHTLGRMLEILAEKGAAPVGIGQFGNMSTFAPTWSSGNEARTLKYRHLPDQGTFRQARGFTERVVADVRAGHTLDEVNPFSMEAIAAAVPQVALTKLVMDAHHIDLNICVRCEECVRKCPVGAIKLRTGFVDHQLCIACFGCVNNCPSGAMKMKFAGKDVWGFNELLRRNGITIQEPSPV
jgi:ferredoxin/flavodoxin